MGCAVGLSNMEVGRRIWTLGAVGSERKVPLVLEELEQEARCEGRGIFELNQLLKVGEDECIELRSGLARKLRGNQGLRHGDCCLDVLEVGAQG